MTNFASIEIIGLRLQRGSHDIVSGLDLRILHGTALIIRGANGSGKTTLLRAIAGLMPISEGRLTINGFSYDDNRTDMHQSMIYIGHRDGFSGNLTAKENLKLWAEAKGHSISQINKSLDEALSSLGMERFANTPLYMMSEGQRKRCGLTRLSLSAAMPKAEPVWVLDEPLAALDQNAAGSLVKMIDQHTEAGGIVIISTHQDISLKRADIINLDITGTNNGDLS